MGQKLDIFHMALSGFKAEGTRLVAELRQQVDNQNLGQSGAAMHAMKGMAATVGAAALAQWAADLERRARTETTIAPAVIFPSEVIAALTDLIERSDAALVATMPPDPTTLSVPDATNKVALPTAQLVTRLLEIQTLLQTNNLRAIDMTKELLSLTTGDDKMKVQGLLNITERLQFQAAEKTVQSWVEGLH